MRLLIGVFVLLSVTIAQDTLFTNSGVAYIGKFIERNETQVVFQELGAPEPQPVPSRIVARVGMYSGKPGDSLPAESAMEVQSEFPPMNGAPKKIKSGFDFGIIGGLNMAKFAGDDASMDSLMNDPEYIYGPSAGFFMIFPVNDRISIRPEILYTAKGARYEYSYNYSSPYLSMSMKATTDMAMNWIEVPVLGIYKGNTISIFGGPFLEFFQDGTSKITFETTMTIDTLTQSESENYTDKIGKKEVNSPVYGFVIGGEYHVTPNIGMQIRYTLGLETLTKKPTDWDTAEFGEYEVQDIRNSGIRLILSYGF